MDINVVRYILGGAGWEPLLAVVREGVVWLQGQLRTAGAGPADGNCGVAMGLHCVGSVVCVRLYCGHSSPVTVTVLARAWIRHGFGSRWPEYEGHDAVARKDGRRTVCGRYVLIRDLGRARTARQLVCSTDGSGDSCNGGRSCLLVLVTIATADLPQLQCTTMSCHVDGGPGGVVSCACVLAYECKPVTEVCRVVQV